MTKNKISYEEIKKNQTLGRFMQNTDQSDLDFRKQYGTKENIRAYQAYCLKNDCFHLVTFRKFMENR